MTYRSPFRDRVVSRLMFFIFRFASEDYRRFAGAIQTFGRAEFDKHLERMRRVEEHNQAYREQQTKNAPHSPGRASRSPESGVVGRPA